MKKPAIPGTGSLPQNLAQVIEPLKTNVEMLTGARPGVSELTKLALVWPDTVTVADTVAQINLVASKVNEIISRINRSG